MITALVIDDYPGTRTAVRRAISGMFDGDGGAIVTEASCATEAISLLRTLRFDVIVSDYHLGTSSGDEILRFLQSDAPDSIDRFVFFTGAGEVASAIHPKVIDKQHAAEFSQRLSALLVGVQIPRPPSRSRRPT